jgi:hypothetical protein
VPWTGNLAINSLYVGGRLEVLPKLSEVDKLTTGQMIGTDTFWMLMGRIGSDLTCLDLQIQLETKNRSLDMLRILQSCPNLQEMKIQLLQGKFGTEGVTEKHFKRFVK